VLDELAKVEASLRGLGGAVSTSAGDGSLAATIPQAPVRPPPGRATAGLTVPQGDIPAGRRPAVLPAIALAGVALAAAWYFLEHGAPVSSRPLQAVMPAAPVLPARAEEPAMTAGRDNRRGEILDRLRGSPAALDFVDKHHEITSDGRLRIWGEVVNSGGRRAGGSSVRVLLTNDANQEVGSADAPVFPPRLGPGESGRFEAYFADPGRSIHISLELNWVS
jgi:hypothetical protein